MSLPGQAAEPNLGATRPRPAEDLERDADRKPQAVMDFLDIEPGMRVAELMAGRGYYTELLSRRVGAEGQVYAHNTPFVADRFARAPLAERLTNPALANVEYLETDLERPGLPPGLDAVVMVLFFHDLYWQDVDRRRMLDRIWRSLEPGGTFGVIDHRAAEGAGVTVVKSLHRVEEKIVREEIEAAGFELVESSDLLTHPEDDRSVSAFDPAVRGKTDRFVHRYRRVDR